MAKHPTHRRRKKPYLTDNVELGRAFRAAYLDELERMLSRGQLRRGQLQVGGSVEFLNDLTARKNWLEQLRAIDWNIFIEGPPDGKSDPANVIKYLAGYLTGGPISDRRILSAGDDEVWIKARPKRSSKKRRGMNVPRPCRLTARQFMQRWCLHILPQNFIRSRAYGGYYGNKREAYLEACQALLVPAPSKDALDSTTEATDSEPDTAETCPHCEGELILVSHQRRPSWREVFENVIYKSQDFSPAFFLQRPGSAAARPPPGKRGPSRGTVS